MLSETILIVDDEGPLRKVLGDLLRMRGFECKAAETATEACAALAQEKFAAAIIDLGLPDMPGIELIRRIKESWPWTECIVLTGQPTQETAIEAVKLGAHSYLEKPLNVEELLGTIHSAIAKHKIDVAQYKDESEPKGSPAAAEPVSASGTTQRLGAWASQHVDVPLGTVMGLAQSIVAAGNLADARAIAQQLQEAVQAIRDDLHATQH
ncbi:MAG: response regulator [Lentisphaeria bacterium]|nr:response regulator [Lentisphaeria bacterium]